MKAPAAIWIGLFRVGASQIGPLQSRPVSIVGESRSPEPVASLLFSLVPIAHFLHRLVSRGGGVGGAAGRRRPRPPSRR